MIFFSIMEKDTSPGLDLIRYQIIKHLPGPSRLIDLTSCICKTMERIINSRLVWYTDSNKILSDLQSGFRKNSSTTDHLVRLETFIFFERLLLFTDSFLSNCVFKDRVGNIVPSILGQRYPRQYCIYNISSINEQYFFLFFTKCQCLFICW